MPRLHGSRSLPPQWQFPARFIGLVAGLFLGTGVIEPVRPALARIAGLGAGPSARLFGLSSTSAGDVLTFDGRFSYVVTFGCSGASAMILIVSAVCALPSTARHPVALRQRVLGCGAGIVVIMLVNYLRLGALAWIGVNAPDQFEVAHIYWFQGLILLSVGSTWLAWLRFVIHPSRPAGSGYVLPTVSDFSKRFTIRFAGLAVVGATLGIDKMYAHLVSVTCWSLAWFAGVDTIRPALDRNMMSYLFGALVGLVALLLATPRPDRRNRPAAPYLVVTMLIATVVAVATLIWPIPSDLPRGLVMVRMLPFDLLVVPVPLCLWFVSLAGPWLSPRRTNKPSRSREMEPSL